MNYSFHVLEPEFLKNNQDIRIRLVQELVLMYQY